MTKLVFLLPFSLLCAACGDDTSTTPHPEEEDPSHHACEHVSESGRAVIASSTIEDAPNLQISDEPNTVELTPGEVGYVGLAASGDALLFLSASDVVTGLFAGGEALDVPEPAPSEACADDIPEHFDLELEGAGPYVLRLGPVGVSSVWLMYTAAAGHGH